MNFFIKTFGCQMNVNDSEKMRYLLEHRGDVWVDDERQADLVIVNSCAVRRKPQEKIHSFVGQLDKNKHIIVAGCVAQIERENLLKKRAAVTFLVGTHQFSRIDKIVDEIVAGRGRGSALAFSKQWDELIPDAKARQSRVSGYISIMEGCDNFCSYCVVPFARGREKHRPFAAIAAEAEYLSRQGYQELILLGQNVNSWHDATADKKFSDLLAYLAENGSFRWIRFITSFPGIHDPDLVRVMADHRPLARHIHFPAQSGSTRMLTRMKRGYTRRRYLEIINEFCTPIPEMKFSSDFIVGFPGETEHDFEQTLSLLKKVGFESLFSFIYSPRPQTAAARLVDDIPADVKKERLKELQRLQAEIQLAANRRQIDRTVEVLTVEPHPRKAGEMIGRTESYRVVNLSSTTPAGRFIRVKITAAGPHSLRGEEIVNVSRP